MTNVSYNLKKLVKNGYLAQERSTYDRRSVDVALTQKARNIRERLSEMNRRHMDRLKEAAVTQADLEAVIMTLRRLERFWMHGNDLAPRAPNLPPEYSDRRRPCFLQAFGSGLPIARRTAAKISG